MLLLRHAAAGSRAEWEGDDRLRPLDARGRRQAEALVDRYGGLRVDAIYASPYRRCVETVLPLAAARGLPVLEREELAEERQGADGIALVRRLAATDAVVCGHGGLEASLPSAGRWRKGETFVVDANLQIVDTLGPRR